MSYIQFKITGHEKYLKIETKNIENWKNLTRISRVKLIQKPSVSNSDVGYLLEKSKFEILKIVT